MNETLKVLKERRSCRKFKEDMITNEELESVLEAGTYAPTGNGKQSPIIIAITNKKIRDELSLENRKVGNMPEGFDPFYNAPVILAVLADKSIKTYLYDGSLVMGNMLNACESLGLGSIWIHRAKEVFEKEFGRTLSSMDCEIINAWIENGFSEELILSALKEAVYNGATSLRYIDKVLYEWNRKGIKAPDDVKKMMEKEPEAPLYETSVMNYNWLNGFNEK